MSIVGERSQNCCPSCGYDRRSGATDICPECGVKAVPPTECPTCRIPIRAWTHEDCPDCGRPLDCEADNDQTPPMGVMDQICSECAATLHDCPLLRCPACGALRLLRLDFAGEDLRRAEFVLQRHGLQIARKSEAAATPAVSRGAIWIRSNCWPSAAWVMESSGVHPLRAVAVMVEGGSCEACGYDLRGIHSLRCPECGRSLPRHVHSRAVR